MDIPFLGQIATQGVLGIILAFSLFTNWYLIKKLQEINDKRVQDSKDTYTKSLDVLDGIKRNSELLISLFTQFLNNNVNNKL